MASVSNESQAKTGKHTEHNHLVGRQNLGMKLSTELVTESVLKNLLKERPLHGGHVLNHEKSPTQINHGSHAERPLLVDLDGHVESGHGGQLEEPLVHGTD